LKYTKYYTPVKIADFLISLIEIKNPKTVVDICCGSYNLLYAAKKKWSDASLIGVDIISHYSKKVRCINSDGREYAINQKKKFPLILANPPFSLMNNVGKFAILYNGNFIGYHTSRLENEMLLANLYLLNNDGLLVIILPNTFIESERNKKIRKLLAETYHIKKIIKLPNNTFGSTGVRSYALFISRKIICRKISKYYEIKSSNDNLSISKGKTIKQENIRKGQWFYNKFKNITKNNIKRGNISSQMFCTKGIIVFHTSKQDNNWTPSIRYIKRKPNNPIYIESGDILISRIGKSAGQWTIHNGKKTLISDCLFCLKDPNGIIFRKIKNRKYNGIIRGVVTPYITQNDFLSWI